MQSFRNILWVFDLNAGAAALEWVASLARNRLTRLTIAEVTKPAIATTPPPRSSVPHDHSVDLAGPNVDHERRHLEQAADALRAHGIHPDIRVLQGIPYLEIAQRVSHGGHDLLVVSAQSRLGMQQQLAESAVLHLAHNCPCHVSLFRAVQGQPRSGILAALASEAKDLECLNLKVLDIAYGLAQAKHYAIHVLHSTTCDHAKLPRKCTVVEHRSNGQPTLEESRPKNAPAGECRSETCPVTSAMNFYYLHGVASRNICRLACDQRVNLIVMGAAWWSDRKRYALDDAEAVLRDAECSVLIVKPNRCMSPGPA